MEFPKESVEQAREIVSKYKKRDRSKRGLASQIYNKHFFRIQYGFSESIRTGNCGRFLHEIQKEADCYTMAGLLYLIAREARLDPQIYWAQGIRDYDEGRDKENEGRNDHSFIVVKTGKKEEIIIDPFMSLFGKVKFDFENNQMQVYDKNERKIIHRDYNLLTPLSQDDYLERLKRNRSSEGGKNVLTSTQRVSSAGNSFIYITYLPKTREIRSSDHSILSRFGPESFEGAYIIDLTTPVDSNGNFSFEDGDVSAYFAHMTGWTEHTNPLVPFSFPIRDAQQLFSFWDGFMRRKGRKAPVLRMFSYKLADMIMRGGFNDDFSLKSGSLAQRLSTKDEWKAIQDWQSQVVDDYVARTKKHERSYKVLLRKSHKTKLSDQRKTRKNPYGFIFTEEEHRRLIKEEFEKFAFNTRESIEKVLEEQATRAKIKKGSVYHSERKTSLSLSKRIEQGQYFGSMGLFNASSFPLSFNILADSFLFERTIDMEQPALELEKGLTDEDIYRGAQRIFFSDLVNIWQLKKTLFLRQYKKGLQKILSSRD